MSDNFYKIGEPGTYQFEPFLEITARIVIPVNKQPILYKIYALKAKQLHMLGMSYEAIGRSLHIGQETARRACQYED